MKPTTKICIQCKVEKSLKAFHKSKSSYLGVNPKCKDCRNVKNPRKPMSPTDSYIATREAEQRYADKNRNKRRAKDAVKQAIKGGLLIKPNSCSHCKLELRVEAHHPDYSEPLEVIWLCITCHNLEHKSLRRI